jgi:cephalosporin hydroxylase
MIPKKSDNDSLLSTGRRNLVLGSSEKSMDAENDSSIRAAREPYHRWYYDTQVWNRTTFLGVPCLKSVSDMWNYQEIIFELKPSLIVEFGAYKGGSTLFFSEILKLTRSDSKVLTVDIKPDQINGRVRCSRHIEVLDCSTTDPLVGKRIHELRDENPGPAFAILDSDHRGEHVLGEMRSLRKALRKGDYLVVEDSNVNGYPVLPNWGDGPMEAILAYEKEFPHDYVHDLEREIKFGFTFAPNGFLIRQ